MERLCAGQLAEIFRCAAHSYTDTDPNLIPRPGAGGSSCDELLPAQTSSLVKIRFTTHAIQYDNNNKALVVAFRGSMNKENWLANFTALSKTFPETWPGAQVHLGFYSAWIELKKLLIRGLQGLGASAQQFNHVIFTGHSLGGAVSTLAAADFVADSAKWDCRILDCSAAVSVVTFGQPHCGNAAFKTAFEKHKIRHLRFVNYTDPVPRILGASKVAVDWLKEKAGGLLLDRLLLNTTMSARRFLSPVAW